MIRKSLVITGGGGDLHSPLWEIYTEIHRNTPYMHCTRQYINWKGSLMLMEWRRGGWGVGVYLNSPEGRGAICRECLHIYFKLWRRWQHQTDSCTASAHHDFSLIYALSGSGQCYGKVISQQKLKTCSDKWSGLNEIIYATKLHDISVFRIIRSNYSSATLHIEAKTCIYATSNYVIISLHNGLLPIGHQSMI